MNNRYFTRLWAAQKVILAKKVRMFIEGCVWIDRVDLTEACHQHVDRKLVHALLTHEGCQIGNNQSLFSCLDHFVGTKWQGARHRVYGLMGLVREGERIVVDYCKLIEHVLLDVLGVWLRTGCPEQCHKTLLQLAARMEVGEAPSNGWKNFVRWLNKEDLIAEHRRHFASCSRGFTSEKSTLPFEAFGYEVLSLCFAWTTTSQVSNIHMGCW